MADLAAKILNKERNGSQYGGIIQMRSLLLCVPD
jgi:hypothetical protein